MFTLIAPFLIQTDSYKAGHAQMYPDVQEMTAYMECRGAFGEAPDDRILFYGMRYLYETVITRKITMKDIEEADAWYAHHGVGESQFYYPRDLWLAVVNENDGNIPLQIKALPEGTVMYPHIPFIQITARGKFARLVTWLETRLTHIWSPIVTATKSRLVWDYLREKFKTSVDDDMQWLLASRLHDFGYRGVSSEETAMTTGCAHLVTFNGSDTMSAGWLATQFNDGNPVGESVLASEHSVMTSWDTELEAVKHLINIAPEGAILSVVADSYDYDNFLQNILPLIAPLSNAKNILFVIRPDSGEPVIQVEKALFWGEKAFGSTVNSKGYKVLTGAAVLQGDGLDYGMLCRIADMVEHKRFSAQVVAYGMGGGLLQKQNRDTLRIATKLSRVVFADGRVEDRMKHPKSDMTKVSLPGALAVYEQGGALTVVPEGTNGWVDNRINIDLLVTIWDNGPTGYKFDNFDAIRARATTQWLRRPRRATVISTELQTKITKILSQ
jgi:nicotinamide phosphoribosyltransferase